MSLIDTMSYNTETSPAGIYGLGVAGKNIAGAPSVPGRSAGIEFAPLDIR